MKKKSYNAGLLKAIEIAGSQNKLAQLIGVTQPTVFYYLESQVPAHRAIQIEKLTGVPKEDLRPDIFGY